MIGPTTNIGERPHRVWFQNPTAPVADGHGGFVQAWTDLAPPALFVKIESATGQALERVKAAGAILAQASHIVTGPFHPQVTSQTRILFNGRTFAVLGVITPAERAVELAMICAEVVA
jgi:head-tail adaptor